MKPALSLKAYALNVLAKREISRAELKHKLMQRLPEGESSDIVEEILDEFSKTGWQSDERYAESYIHSKGSRQGSLRLKHTLAQKGVSEDIIEEYLPDASEEYATAAAVLRKKFPTPATTPQEKQKQMRFLAYRGFSSDIIYQVLKTAWQDDSEIY